ncbi:hypothetical protein HY450_01400 [Candidatus Pacearchaeota archaeon]|nr:hypothetical protein [Candidatus Pacearchaeota archaeon]
MIKREVVLHLVHKKYTYKNGKRYGPYLYENKRVGEKIITTYLGTEKDKRVSKKVFYSVLFGILFLSLIILFFKFGSPTGKVSLDVKSSYEAGENITGSLIFNLRQGELIPKDSLVVVKLGSVEKEFLLSELISDELVEGEFYAEGVSISGSGQGFGSIGERESFPEVDFKLSIIESVKSSEEINVAGGAGGGGKEAETDSGEEIPTEPADEESGSGATTNDETETGTSTENQETDNEGTQTSEEAENSQLSSETSSSGSENSAGTETTSETSSDSGGDSTAASSGVTGSAVSESEFVIDGKVRSGEEFSYNLEEGQTVELVEGSVSSGNNSLGEDVLILSIGDNLAKVTTEYSEIEKGFGEDFLGDEVLKMESNLDNFVLTAADSSELEISLVYQSVEIVKVSKTINVEEAQSLEGNESVELVDLNNETLILNETAEKIPEINVSVFTNTSARIVLGQPVKWTKKIDVQGPANLTIELPEDAENVTIKKIKKLEKTDEDEVEETKETIEEPGNLTEQTETSNNETGKQAENQGIGTVQEEENPPTETIVGEINIDSNDVITGQVSAEIELGRESKITQWLKKIFRVTGLAVSNSTEENVKEISVEVNETDESVEIVYETPAPYSVEEETENGKVVRVFGPDSVHYENVLAFTTLREELEIREPSIIRIYWAENLTYLPVENVSDLDANGIYDYVEWSVQSLSNQTFEIILITKAEHLDENRTLISDIYSEVKELDGNWSEPIYHNQYVRVTFEQNLTKDKDITVYARASCASNSSVLINDHEVSCEIYQKKTRIDEIRRELK